MTIASHQQWVSLLFWKVYYFMKTLQLTKFYPPVRGGIETVSYELATGLMAKGIATDVLCSNLTLRSVREVGDAGEAIVRVGSFGKMFSMSVAPLLILELYKTRTRYDIIHVQLPNPLACLAIWLARPKCRIILHWQSDIINQKWSLRVFLPLQKWILERADIIATSSQAYADFSPWLSTFKEKVVALPLGIREKGRPSDLEIAAVKEQYGERKIVFSLGRMTYYKGFDILIDAAELEIGDAVIVVGGDGELLETYREEVRRRNLDAKIIFIGPLTEDEVRVMFFACDVFCLASKVRAEAFGVVLLEAMTASKPLITTDIPGSGVPWVNLSNVSGLNVPPCDPIALAETINKLVCDPQLRKKLGQGARRRYDSMFSAERMIENTIKLYKSII